MHSHAEIHSGYHPDDNVNISTSPTSWLGEEEIGKENHLKINEMLACLLL